MKGHVSRRGKTWAYWFDIDPDPLTGKRRQRTQNGFTTEKAAWKACRDAIAGYECGQVVSTTRRRVGPALDEWLTRIEHSIKPSMAQNWRDYAASYVVPYVGQREVQEIDGAVCDALYAKLLAEGRVKAKPKTTSDKSAVHVRRVTAAGKVQPCRPYRYDALRCYSVHAGDDPLIGQPIEPSRRVRQKVKAADRKPLSPGLEPKTVVNTHRMLHRAWEDFVAWGWAKQNVVADAHPPPRSGQGPQGLDGRSAPDVLATCAI